METKLDIARKWISDSQNILFTSGAGMSADCGVGTFRGQNMASWPPLEGRLDEDGQPLDWADVSCPQWFEQGDNEERFAWAFWLWRYEAYSKAVPHEGYHIAVELAKQKGIMSHAFSYTSNIDGLWIKAGFPGERVAEIHGSSHYLQCVKGANCVKEDVWSAVSEMEALRLNAAGDSVVNAELPRCHHCGSRARPNVLMFCDSNQIDPRYEEPSRQYGAFWNRIDQNHETFCILELGCGLDIPDVRTHAELLVSKSGGRGRLIRVNLASSDALFDNEYLSSEMIANQCLGISGMGANDFLTKIR